MERLDVLDALGVRALPRPDGGPPRDAEAVSIAVGVREIYHEPGSGRRSCAFAVAFASGSRELRRNEVAMWQARMREAIQLWAESEAFELR